MHRNGNTFKEEHIMKKTIWRITVEDEEGTAVATRDFDTYGEASAMQDELLGFTWHGFWSAPTVSSREVEVEA